VPNRKFARAFVLLPMLAAATGARAADPAPSAAGPAPGFLRALAETRGFALGHPTRVRVTADGKAVLFLRTPPRDPTLALYEMDLGTGKTRQLITPAALLGGAEERLSVAERARRERQRIVDRGFVSYDLSEDGRRVLIPLSGKVYVFDREGAAAGAGGGKPAIRALGGGDPPVLDPRFSPDGAQVAYVRGQDLYVADVATGKERRLTRGGTELVTHGLAEFIAQEEMSRFAGYFWSPDARRLAYTEVDQRALERFSIADPTHPETPANVFPYPRAGKANAKVRLGLISARGGPTTWVRWDAERYPYLARVLWREKAAPLTILVQTRDQREQALLAVDPASGATRALLVDKDPAWVELDDSLPRWLPDGSGFLHVSERSGRRELELHRPDGGLERVVMAGAQGFHSLEHVSDDGRTVYALSATPVSTRLWQLAVRGSEPPRALTEDGAEHRATFAKRAPVFVDTRMARDALPESAVYRLEAGVPRKLGVLPAVAEAPPFRVNLELQTVGPEGRFHAAVIRPRAFRKGQRYPVVVNVYGGPTALTVRADERFYLLHQWIADHGVVVVTIDNRGTPRRDRAWSRAIKGNFAGVALDDQVEALRALGARVPELDLSRVGIYGWSFGGYMSALAVMKRPEVFRAAVAGAPVVDWRDYDTHYTERYLGHPDSNRKGYDESSLLSYAPRLGRPLLLIHGTTDDNVYFLHSLKLANALFRAGRPFEFLPLTVTHQVPDPVVREQLWSRIVEFLLKNLR
jgi:dipeptidyl-peptidase 4